MNEKVPAVQVDLAVLLAPNPASAASEPLAWLIPYLSPFAKVWNIGRSKAWGCRPRNLAANLKEP
jgi:hypothetical protein